LFASLKPAALSILRPLTGALIRGHVHPNTLTFLGLSISCAAAAAFATGSLVWAASLVLVSGLFDMLDGAVARESRRVSRYGAFLDSSIDRYAEIVLFAGILWRFREEPWTAVATLAAAAGSLMVSYTKARAEGLGGEVSGGLMQRPERVVLLALGAYFGEHGLRVVMWILAILTNVTSVQRMFLASGSLASEEPESDRERSPERSMDSRDVEAAPPPV
jgi:CDP-diacylglycerol--glycerol-3-phosphate 3-phosphatidyltransferase